MDVLQTHNNLNSNHKLYFVLSSLLQMSSLPELVRDLRGVLNAVINLEKEFKEDDEFINDIKAAVLKIAKIGFTDAAGGALHRLKDTKPSINTVKKLIRGNPDALSF